MTHHSRPGVRDLIRNLIKTLNDSCLSMTHPRTLIDGKMGSEWTEPDDVDKYLWITVVSYSNASCQNGGIRHLASGSGDVIIPLRQTQASIKKEFGELKESKIEIK